MNVGDVFATNYWGDAEVVELLGGRRIVVRFVNTGNVRQTRSDYLLLGNVKDTEAASNGVDATKKVPKSLGTIPVGTKFKTNFYGEVEVVKFVNSKNIQVKFLDTGNLLKVQRYVLELGQVQDVVFRDALIAEKAVEAEKASAAYWEDRLATAERNKARDAELARLKETARASKAAESLTLKAITAQEKIASMQEKEYINSMGDVFRVVGRGSSPCFVVVEFPASGNRYEVKTNRVSCSAVQDTLSDNYLSRYKEAAREKSAKWYEDNRADRIAKAGAYQKENLERTRERNRKSAARRVSANGGHTKAELSGLLLSQGCKCACCGYDLSSGKHIDHIMPLILGGTNDIENMQWLCQVCNSIKADRHPDEWSVYSVSDAFKERLALRRKTI